MKISIVTISFNQARFIERTLQSVLEQDYNNLEYIVIDAGSTDGSREIIQKYHNSITKVIFEPDDGPADGLNKGFSHATGDVFGFLNADDVLLPGCCAHVAEQFSSRSEIDVLMGNGYVIDADDKVIRQILTDPFHLRRFAYRCVTFIQPSVFFRANAFRQLGGFATTNKTCWDAELLVDLALNGNIIARTNRFLSCFRLHPDSISGSQRLRTVYERDWQTVFRKVVGRGLTWYDVPARAYHRLMKSIVNPYSLYNSLKMRLREPNEFDSSPVVHQ